MAAELLMVAERRRPDRPGDQPGPAAVDLHQFVRDSGGQARRISRPVPVAERPPAASHRTDIPQADE
jgi:hypothetical protein